MEEKQKKRLLWVGDAACPSGFAMATHNILGTLHQHYDVTVLGINYNGDPHEFPYPIYAAGVGGDGFGVGRLQWMCNQVKPDVIVLQNDGWNIPFYIQKLQQRLPNGNFLHPDFAKIPVVACVAVDGKNFNGEWLRGVSLAIFWTQFALDEARAGRYAGPAKVIPLGVNLETYKPLDRQEVRKQNHLGVIGENAFIVGAVNRNQPRKRLDLTIKCFAKWITDNNIDDAWLYIHSAPTGDMCVDVMALARYYHCADRTILLQPPVFYGVTEDQMCATYNCFDVSVSTTQGEGMGLPALESMACGVPCLLPDWSAYGEWATDAAVLVPCATTRIDFPYVNVIGGVVDENAFIVELDRLYRDPVWRMSVASAGFRRVSENRFRWRIIGAQYVEAIGTLVAAQDEEKQAEDKKVVEERKHEERVEKSLKIMRGEVPA